MVTCKCETPVSMRRRHAGRPVIELLRPACMIRRSNATTRGRSVDLHPALQRPLRIACVTETYPPEVNGVAMTIARLVQSLRERQHTVQVVRPRQAADA